MSETSTLPGPIGHRPPGTPSRRDFLRSAAGAAGLVVAGAAISACDVVADVDDPLVHLLKRAAFGVRTADLDRLRTVGATAWLDEQLDLARLDLGPVEAKVAQLPDLGATAAQLASRYRGSGAGLAAAQLVLATAIRQIESPAQLYERMVEFWSDHLNVAMLDENLRILKVVEDREVIRRHTFGRFRDLLLASAASPAMLVYLDGARSFAGAINENYARELLELHSVGVDGGYTEEDIVNLARLLTGWTVDPRTGLFRFDAARHDAGPVTIMGWTRPSGGDPFDHGRQFVAWVASHPSTARFLATKLARRFVADEPDPGLVDHLASTYLANDTAIVPVLRALFAHPAFAAAAGDKFRRPHDWLVAAARAVDAKVTPSTDERAVQGLGSAVGLLGQMLFAWPAPNGYPDVEGAWMTSGGLLARWNFAGDLVVGQVPLVAVDQARLRTGLAGLTIDEALDRLAERVLHEPLTENGRHVLRAHTGLQPGTRLNSATAFLLVPRIVPLLLSTADFQYR